MEQSPITAQEIAKKMRMIKVASKILPNLSQALSSKLPQLISSGVGTLSLFICNF